MPEVSAVVNWVETVFMPYKELGLFFLAFIESSFFPVPPDVLLVPLALRRPLYAPELALVASVGSVLGGGFGYWLGKKGGRPLLRRFSSEAGIERVAALFHRYSVWAVGIAGFTPIPYKIFTIASGVFLMNFRQFILVSLVSRSARFFLEALLIMHYGEEIVDFLMTRFEAGTIVIVLLAAALSYLGRCRKQRR